MIQINFILEGFSDALWLADDHSLSDAEIETMKQTRYDKWRNFIDNPPVVVDEE